MQVADRFMYQAFEADGLPSVLWVIELKPHGASSVVRRCKQAVPAREGLVCVWWVAAAWPVPSSLRAWTGLRPGLDRVDPPKSPTEIWAWAPKWAWASVRACGAAC